MNQLQKGFLRRKFSQNGMVTICCSCKKIRDRQGRWQRVGGYEELFSGQQVSHGVCRECAAILFPAVAGIFDDSTAKGGLGNLRRNRDEPNS